MRACQEITLLIEKSKFVRLPINVRMELFLHKKICDACNRYARDSKSIDKLLSKRRQEISQYDFSNIEKDNLKKLLVRLNKS